MVGKARRRRRRQRRGAGRGAAGRAQASVAMARPARWSCPGCGLTGGGGGADGRSSPCRAAPGSFVGGGARGVGAPPLAGPWWPGEEAPEDRAGPARARKPRSRVNAARRVPRRPAGQACGAPARARSAGKAAGAWGGRRVGLGRRGGGARPSPRPKSHRSCGPPGGEAAATSAGPPGPPGLSSRPLRREAAVDAAGVGESGEGGAAPNLRLQCHPSCRGGVRGVCGSDVVFLCVRGCAAHRAVSRVHEWPLSCALYTALSLPQCPVRCAHRFGCRIGCVHSICAYSICTQCPVS
jgi:hypothetical protein